MICLISEELHFCRFPDLQRTAMAVFQMEGHPGKRKIQHKQIWHHRRGQIWQYVLHTCTPHTCILVFCLVYMYETFITYNNNMHCAYVHVELLMLIYICATLRFSLLVFLVSLQIAWSHHDLPHFWWNSWSRRRMQFCWLQTCKLLMWHFVKWHEMTFYDYFWWN